MVGAAAGVFLNAFLGVVERFSNKQISFPVIPRVYQLNKLDGFLKSDVLHATILRVEPIVPGDERHDKLSLPNRLAATPV
jgi:hypothetical protein